MSTTTENYVTSHLNSVNNNRKLSYFTFQLCQQQQKIQLIHFPTLLTAAENSVPCTGDFYTALFTALHKTGCPLAACDLERVTVASHTYSIAALLLRVI